MRKLDDGEDSGLMATPPPSRTVASMRRRLFTAVAATVALGFAAVVGYVALDQSTTPAVVVVGDDWASSVKACVPEVSVRNGSTYANAGVVNCLTEVMEQAYNSGKTADFALSLQAAVDADQALYDVCHPAAHTAGLNALRNLNDPVAALDAVAGSTVCDWGMGHGVMDSLSEQNPSKQTFVDVTAWCDERVADQRLYGLCTDGLGHLAWGATKSFDESIKLCELVGTSEGRKACGGGILMQVFAPAAHSASIPLEEAPKRLPALCADWASKVEAEGAARGCYAGAAYLYSLDLKDQMYLWWNSSEYQPGVDIPTDIRTAIDASMTRAVEACAMFPAEGRASCENGLANNIPTRYGAEHPVEMVGICRLFSDEPSRAVCNAVGDRIQQ
jgi:hypothetical protein